jgi:hypothetical protein
MTEGELHGLIDRANGVKIEQTRGAPRDAAGAQEEEQVEASTTNQSEES